MHKLVFIYALDMFHNENQLCLPLKLNLMKGANILITNGYFSPVMYDIKVNKVLNYVSEE